uniref:Uncharacterized protein n=1 Tax=Amphimedon queenslandica TaxID=400682 RepID=A0A1X7TGH5_AMPQE
FIECFCSVFMSKDQVYEKVVTKWIIFLLNFLKIGDHDFLPVLREIVHHRPHLKYCPSLLAEFSSQVQRKGNSCYHTMSLSYFTDLSKCFNGKLWTVEIANNFFKNYIKYLRNDSVLSNASSSSLSHFSD